TEELLIGIYEVAVLHLRMAVREHVRDTNPLADAPSVRVCQFADVELRDMIGFGAEVLAALTPPERTESTKQWVALLNDSVDAAGGLSGIQPRSGKAVSRMHSATPYAYDPVPRRDERFGDPYNMGVNAEAFLYDPSMPADAKVLMLLYKRLREVDVPEMMAGIIHQTRGKPWGYYRAMTRQLWDEARHAMMGEVGFRALGIDWPRLVPVNFNWSLALNTQLGPKERHAVLYFIEQGLMPKTGKRYEWEVATAGANPLAATL